MCACSPARRHRHTGERAILLCHDEMSRVSTCDGRGRPVPPLDVKGGVSSVTMPPGRRAALFARTPGYEISTCALSSSLQSVTTRAIDSNHNGAIAQQAIRPGQACQSRRSLRAQRIQHRGRRTSRIRDAQPSSATTPRSHATGEASRTPIPKRRTLSLCATRKAGLLTNRPASTNPA